MHLGVTTQHFGKYLADKVIKAYIYMAVVSHNYDYAHNELLKTNANVLNST